jgi:hypothetical protein
MIVPTTLNHITPSWLGCRGASQEATELLGAPYDDLPLSVGSTLNQLKKMKSHLACRRPWTA